MSANVQEESLVMELQQCSLIEIEDSIHIWMIRIEPSFSTRGKIDLATHTERLAITRSCQWPWIFALARLSGAVNKIDVRIIAQEIRQVDIINRQSELNGIKDAEQTVCGGRPIRTIADGWRARYFPCVDSVAVSSAYVEDEVAISGLGHANCYQKDGYPKCENTVVDLPLFRPEFLSSGSFSEDNGE